MAVSFSLKPVVISNHAYLEFTCENGEMIIQLWWVYILSSTVEHFQPANSWRFVRPLLWHQTVCLSGSGFSCHQSCSSLHSTKVAFRFCYPNKNLIKSFSATNHRPPQGLASKTDNVGVCSAVWSNIWLWLWVVAVNITSYFWHLWVSNLKTKMSLYYEVATVMFCLLGLIVLYSDSYSHIIADFMQNFAISIC